MTSAAKAVWGWHRFVWAEARTFPNKTTSYEVMAWEGRGFNPAVKMQEQMGALAPEVR